MDFKNFKEKVLKLKDDTVKFSKKVKDNTVKFTNKTIDNSAKKLSESSYVIKTKEDLDEIISKSKNTSFTNKDTLETKEFTKHSIIIFSWKDTDFYKDALISLPVLVTKAWSGWVALKMCNLDLKYLSEYKITEIPSLVLFTNEKLEKIVNGEKNINSIVKTLNLDIIKAIENI